MPQTRRDVLQRSAALAALAALLAGVGLLPTQALAQAGWNKLAFEVKTLDEVMKALGAAKPVESKDISLVAPDIAENGAVVPLGASTALPGVKWLALLVEKNPNALSALFEFSEFVDASALTRINVKMGQTSNVYAVAMMADGRVLFTQKEVKVTVGGCGG